MVPEWALHPMIALATAATIIASQGGHHRRLLSYQSGRAWSFDIMSTSFFLSRRPLRPDARSGMPTWQDQLFIFLAQNADDASTYFQLPTDRVVEIGTQVTCLAARPLSNSPAA
jgi:K+ transporter